MASPDVADALTQQYQTGQRRISRTLLAELLRLWRAVVDPDDFSTFQQFAELAARLVGEQRSESAQAAARFYALFRATQVVPASTAALLAGEAAPVPRFAPVEAPPLQEPMVAGLLRGAALSGFVNGRRAGQSERRALDNALVKASGSATRVALNGGRDTILASARADEEALGWVRVTDGDPCAFCLVLASRGPEYKTEATASFEAHDHCGCTARPVYPGTRALAATIRAESVYKVAQRWARKNGISDPDKPNYAIANVRAYLARDT